MPLFPMFLDLSDDCVLVVGEGAEADRKAARLAPFCKAVMRCDYPPVYENPPALVVLAEKEHPDNEIWAAHFRALGVMVNVADRPELCDFRFPSLIVRGDVSIGIATDGKSPALAGLLRERIDDALPEELEEICRYAAQQTAALRQSVPDPKIRAEILRRELKKLLK